jgi:hypothetical protein
LVAHGRLLVAILLRWGWAVAGLLLVLAWGRAVLQSRVLVMLFGIGCGGVEVSWAGVVAMGRSWYGGLGGAYP